MRVCVRALFINDTDTFNGLATTIPWVMRVLAFLIVDDAAKEHAARPLIGPRLSFSLSFFLSLSLSLSLSRTVRVIYRKLLLARSKYCCLRGLRIKVDSHSSPVAL